MLFLRFGSFALAAGFACCAVSFAQTAATGTKKIVQKKAVAPATPPAGSDEEKFAKRAARLWCLQPVKRPDVPAGITDSTNPIDAFIAEQYRAKGLQPSAKADRLTLLRRVTLDLTGLPPTPSEQEAFLADTSDQAWDHVVEGPDDKDRPQTGTVAPSFPRRWVWTSTALVPITSRSVATSRF